jgi:hypothetical protein
MPDAVLRANVDAIEDHPIYLMPSGPGYDRLTLIHGVAMSTGQKSDSHLRFALGAGADQHKHPTSVLGLGRPGLRTYYGAVAAIRRDAELWSRDPSPNRVLNSTRRASLRAFSDANLLPAATSRDARATLATTLSSRSGACRP